MLNTATDEENLVLLRLRLLVTYEVERSMCDTYSFDRAGSDDRYLDNMR